MTKHTTNNDYKNAILVYEIIKYHTKELIEKINQVQSTSKSEIAKIVIHNLKKEPKVVKLQNTGTLIKLIWCEQNSSYRCHSDY